MLTFPHKKWNPFIQLDLHKGIFLNGPIPIPGAAWHVGVGVFAMPGDHKFNEHRVFADGMEIVSRGHELNYIFPHWNLFPFSPAQPNILIPLLFLGSSSKCIFAVGSVVGKDGPIAVSVIFKYAGLNFACADPVMMPTSLVINWGSVELGFTWGDLCAAILCYLYDLLVAEIMDALGGWLVGLLPPGLLKGPFLSLLRASGLPKIFRGEGGRFASMALELSEKTLDFMVGEALDGVGGIGGELGVPAPGDMAADAATHVGAWVDGRAELFGD
jgi:hypothetical protein